MKKVTNTYRSNVSALVLNQAGEVLSGERKDEPGHWQFPQGGVDEGEDLQEALLRELREELGVVDFLVLAQSTRKFRYLWQKEVQQERGILGQEQTFFLVRFLGNPRDLSVELPEFSRFIWVSVSEVLERIQPVRRKIYSEVLADFSTLISQEVAQPRSLIAFRIFQAVQRIPKGKVATYGAIAKAVGKPRGARLVGWMLHANPYSPIVPCHRVVFANGSLAQSFGMGGWDAQEALLRDEGVEVHEKKVDLSKYLMSRS